MFVKIQANKFYNLNEILSIEIKAMVKEYPESPLRSYIQFKFINRHPDGEISTVFWYGDDCSHGNDQFKKDIEALYKATHTKMWTEDRQVFKFE